MTLIALIDDDINIVTSLKIMFESEGFTVISTDEEFAGVQPPLVTTAL